jgi:hypothetical protein
MKPRPLHVVVCSSSDATLAFLENMFDGFKVKLVSTIPDTQIYLQSLVHTGNTLDFVVLDDQSETHADELARFIRSLSSRSLHDTRVLHLYTPITSGAGHDVFGNRSILGVVKMTKPPRKARMLQFLASLKNVSTAIAPNPSSDVAKAMEAQAAAQRTLYGNVLVAEGIFDILLSMKNA